MNYHGVVRDGENNLLANQNIRMLISILKGDAEGVPVYIEMQSPKTNFICITPYCPLNLK